MTASRLRRFGRGLFEQTLVQPVAAGRLRDEDWPYGLRAVVATGYVVFAVAALTVVASGPLRRQATLLIAGNSSLGLPASTVGLLVVLLSFGVACLVVAALHGPWWLKVLGLVLTLALMASWSVRSPSLAGGWTWVLIGLAAVLTMLVGAVVRWRATFRWPEFAVAWFLVGLAMLCGVVEGRYGQTFGGGLVPLNLQQTAALLGFLALPAALVAGAAVAEITVRATVAATRGAQLLSRPAWAYGALAALLGLRLVEVGWQLAHRDPVSQGWNLLLPALVVTVLFAAVGTVLLRLSRRHGAVPVVSELGDELGGIGYAVAAALLAVLVPVTVGAAVVPVLVGLNPGGAVGQSWVNRAPNLVGELVDPLRAALGAVLVVVAVRDARRGRAGRALVLGCVGVMLIALARRLVLGDVASAPTDPDALNLVATALTVVAVVGALVTRRLTPVRAVAFAGVLVLSALFAHRTLIADPLAVVLGLPGAALLLLGLTWDLLTGAGWGNGSSRRFPRPTRVLLVLTNAVLTMTVLAYAALVRDGSTTIYLDPYAELGDLVFGTGLLAAAVIAVFDAAFRERPVA